MTKVPSQLPLLTENSSGVSARSCLKCLAVNSLFKTVQNGEPNMELFQCVDPEERRGGQSREFCFLAADETTPVEPFGVRDTSYVSNMW